MFKEELRVLYHSSLNTKCLTPLWVTSSLLLLCMGSQDSKSDNQCFEMTTRIADILLDSESAVERGAEYWLWNDNFMYIIIKLKTCSTYTQYKNSLENLVELSL